MKIKYTNNHRAKRKIRIPEFCQKEKCIAVLAGNLEEFIFYSRGNPEYEYIDFPGKAFGREFSGHITVGTFYEKEGWEDLLKLVKSKIRQLKSKVIL